ncbi:MAG: hypothetical protein IH892_13730 [Planctomycetes bacterium]|nr:hypothetical protein [Planctomycetota bacterium]
MISHGGTKARRGYRRGNVSLFSVSPCLCEKNPSLRPKAAPKTSLLSKCLLIFAFIPHTYAFELWSDPDGRRTDLDVAVKWTSLTSHPPDDPLLYPPGTTWTELARLRLGLTSQHSDRLSTQIAYEQAFRWQSKAGAVAGGVLPPTADVPFRIKPLQWHVTDPSAQQLHEHEIDRLLAAYHADWGDITVGRQALGLGRGVVFSALDLFVPFSPLDIDREWRRGVDALRIERRVTDTSSVELLGVFGETWEQSALLARARGYVAAWDADLIFGKRADDTLIGTSLSAPWGGAEVHGEVTYFHTAEAQPDGGAFGRSHSAIKAVAGTSYTFNWRNWRNGVTVLGEFHYNGLGVRDIAASAAQIADPQFVTRLLRGDMQILSQQALALQVSHPLGLTLSTGLLVLQSPTDGSGLLAPSLVWDIGDTGRILTSVYVPWGDEPMAGQLQSEYGGTPLSLFVQGAWYR